MMIVGIGALVAVPRVLYAADSFDGDGDSQVTETDVTHEQSEEPGTVAPNEGRSERDRVRVTQTEPEKGGLDDQIVGIQLQGGFVNVEDTLGAGETRAMAGLSFDANLLSAARTSSGKPFLGPAIGIFYSHLGQSGSNFFGLNGPAGDKGGDLALIPVDLKLGYTFGEAFRIAGHGGMTFDYQKAQGADWDVNPNVGGDLEFGLGKSVSLLFRADWLLRSTGPTPFSGTLGIGFPLS